MVLPLSRKQPEHQRCSLSAATSVFSSVTEGDDDHAENFDDHKVCDHRRDGRLLFLVRISTVVRRPGPDEDGG